MIPGGFEVSCLLFLGIGSRIVREEERGLTIFKSLTPCKTEAFTSPLTAVEDAIVIDCD